MSCVQGMYLFDPVVVPDVSAKKGIRPGQDTSVTLGKAGAQ